MEALSIILGTLGISFLLFYFANNLDTEIFWLNILKLFVVLFALFFLIVVPKAMLNSDCELLLHKTHENSTYIYGNNFTTGAMHWSIHSNSAPNTNNDIFLFHLNTTKTHYYSEYCKDTDTTATIAFNAYLFFVGIIGIFMLIYYTVTVFDYFKKRKNGE
jgi:hypothetical protein